MTYRITKRKTAPTTANAIAISLLLMAASLKRNFENSPHRNECLLVRPVLVADGLAHAHRRRLRDRLDHPRHRARRQLADVRHSVGDLEDLHPRTLLVLLAVGGARGERLAGVGRDVGDLAHA